MNIRKTIKADLPGIQACNESALPHVNSLTLDDLQWFMTHSRDFLTVEIVQEVVGFVIVLGPDLDYDSLNYGFFNTHFSDFDYVDRIVISDAYRSKSIGTSLYQYLFDKSDSGLITCEVNLKPGNPVSLSFHKKMGFNEIARQFTEGGNKAVSFLVNHL